jgi:hypothetical protein
MVKSRIQRIRNRPFRQRWGLFYRAFFRDLSGNLVLVAPLLLVFALVVVASASVLCILECSGAIPSWTVALFVTWMAITTVGLSAWVPQSDLGRLLVAFDSLIGYVLLGLIVFVIAKSAERYGTLD